jgi:hypothetical protein
VAALKPIAADGPGRCFALALVAAALFLAPTARAELYRCAKADGELVFTDSPANCPGAKLHDAGGDLQAIGGSGPAAPARPAASDARARNAELRQEKAAWQQKKRTAQRDLARAEGRSGELQRYVTACNRGVNIIGRDATGMKYTVPCQRVRAEHDENEAQLTALRAYLENGLRRECREAGCLPGWIR